MPRRSTGTLSVIAVAAFVVGAVGGFTFWVVGIIVTSGVCSVPVLSELWCTIVPGPGGTVEPTISIFDVLWSGVITVAAGVAAANWAVENWRYK